MLNRMLLVIILLRLMILEIAIILEIATISKTTLLEFLMYLILIH